MDGSLDAAGMLSALASQNIKVRLQYRFDFFMGAAGMIIVNLSRFFSIWLIFGSVPVLAGWSYYEILFLQGFVMLAGSFEYLFFDHLWQLNEDIMQGVFTKYYLRPHEINPILYASPLVGVLLFSLAYLAWKKGVYSYSGTGT